MNVISTRRHFVRRAASVGLISGIPAAASAQPDGGKVITLPEYRRYLELFTSLDEGVFDYFSDDMVFRVGNRNELKSPKAIFESYRRRLLNVREIPEVLFFCSDSAGLAAELLTEYRCIRDEDDPTLFGRALKKGEVRRSLGVALYTVKNGKFTSMHGNPQTVDDWHMPAEQGAQSPDAAAAADGPSAK